MRTELDPIELTPDERRHEVAAIFAKGLLRLRDRHALGDHPATSPNPEILATASKETLAIPPEPSVTVHAG